MTTAKHSASDDGKKHAKRGPRGTQHDMDAVHVPKMGKGRPKPKPEQGEANVAPVAEQAVAAEPAEKDVPVKITSALAGLPPPGKLPPPASLPQAATAPAPVAAPSAQTLAPTAPVASPMVAATPTPRGDGDGDASHTKMLLVIFLVTLLGGGAAIAYFLMTQKVNPLEGLF